jgi:hypothetical protein
VQKLIHIEDVKLKSMSVEIKAMTVNGKQMTLAVFRQLPPQSIFDDEYKLLGIPWGRVVYFWGNDKDCNGFQVVWQQQDTLFRSMHWEPKFQHTDYVKRKELDDFMWDIKRKHGCGEPKKQNYIGREHDYEEAMAEYRDDVRRYYEAENTKNILDENSERSLADHQRAYQDLAALPQLFIAL